MHLIAQINYTTSFDIERVQRMTSEFLRMLNTSDYSSVISMNLFVALLCACIVIGHLLEDHRWANESITALLIVSFFVIFLLPGSTGSNLLVGF